MRIQKRFGSIGFDLPAAHQFGNRRLDPRLACLGMGEIDVSQHDLHTIARDRLGNSSSHLAGTNYRNITHKTLSSHVQQARWIGSLALRERVG
jgi:hypothetical protein